jgi:hypothetical protein
MRSHYLWAGLAVVLVGGLVLGRLGSTNRPAPDDTPPEPPPADQALPVEAIDAVGIGNLFRLGPELYSGSEPHGRAGFAALNALGVRTILSVDGARTDVATAGEFGMRYVHLPIGYDGIPNEQALRMIKAVRELPGPIFIHCHHGKHRGPAAAAIICRATESWTAAQAVDWLQTAKTSPHYVGLYRSVTEFVVPGVDVLANIPADFPETAEVPPLVDAMVAIDAHWEELTAIRAAGFRAPPEHPDIEPAHEAKLLHEQFQELLRSEETDGYGTEFARILEESAQAAGRLEAALRRLADNRDETTLQQADRAWQAVADRCTGCHREFRDRQ